MNKSLVCADAGVLIKLIVAERVGCNFEGNLVDKQDLLRYNRCEKHRNFLILTDSVVEVRSPTLRPKQAFLWVNFSAKRYKTGGFHCFSAQFGQLLHG